MLYGIDKTISEETVHYGNPPCGCHSFKQMSNTKSQVITCKAAVCWGAGEPFRVEEIQVEPPKASEVRVKLLYASVCHTDLLYAGDSAFGVFPRVMGHEGAGVVESVGEEVEDIKEGDLVIPTYIGECQTCENCLSGKTNLCLTYPLTINGLMLDGTTRMSIRGQPLYQMFSCSTWSEYTVVDANYIVKIDQSLTLVHGSFLSCGFSTGLGAAWKEAKVEKGSTVAVLGLGAVGLGVIEGARLQGVAQIIGIDKNPRKKEKGNAFGMTHFINPDESTKSISELVIDLTGGTGVDYSFECTGAAPLANQAIEATKLGKGQTILIGAGAQESLQINFMSIICGRTLKGTIFGGVKPKSDLPTILQKCKDQETQLDELLTHEVLLQDMNKAVEILRQPDCVKVSIKF